MVQVTTSKSRKVYTDLEWKLIWISVFMAGSVVGSLVTYTCTGKHVETKNPTADTIRIREVVPPVEEPEDYSEDFSEKHFNCWVNEIVQSKNETMYITECGVPFYSDAKYMMGDTLYNFNSPKHR